MVLKDGADELDLTLKIKVDGFDYFVYASSDTTMKCFGCKQIGHLVRACPERVIVDTAVAEPGSAGPWSTGPVVAGPVVAVPPAAAAGSVVQVPAPVSELGVAESAANSVACNEILAVVPSSVKVDLTVEDLDNALEPPNTEEQDTEVRGVFTDVTPAEVVVQEGDVDMEEVFKVPPNKRKLSAQETGNKQAKTEVSAVESDGAESDYSEDESLSDSCLFVGSQDEMPVLYTADNIRKFLKVTYGKRGVQVGKYFSDSAQFINDVKFFKREGFFTSKEKHRLNKILTRLTKDSNDVEV